MTETRDPIVIADTGPLIRLAAAGLLDAIALTNRQVVMVDRIEEEACGDASKPFAAEIAAWLTRMGSAVTRAQTLEGIAIRTLRAEAATAEDYVNLKRKLRNSGERAIREYVESIDPRDADAVLVLYEDGAIPKLMQAADVPLTMMTTRAFANLLGERGHNRDAAKAIDAISAEFNTRPPTVSRIEPYWTEEESGGQ